MAENEDGQEKTEDPTPERREEFRSKGQVAVSREIPGVLNLLASAVFLTLTMPMIVEAFSDLLTKYFYLVRGFRIDAVNLPGFVAESWLSFLKLSFPLFVVTTIISVLSTFMQTRVNWSWKKLKPDFGRMNPLKGLKNMVNLQATVNLAKGIMKMLAVTLVSYLILYSERFVVPGLMKSPLIPVWQYWGEYTSLLFYSVAGLLVVVALGDYLHNLYTIEKQMKMSKQEVKEDLKKHEVDAQVKGRMKKMQRDIVFSKTIQATRDATVVVTNPTHFAVALKYEPGMGAPVVVAKGKDELALYMREVAKEAKVPVIENKPVARLLYRVVEVGQEIPESVYKAVSEIIRYVFKMKGLSVRK